MLRCPAGSSGVNFRRFVAVSTAILLIYMGNIWRQSVRILTNKPLEMANQPVYFFQSGKLIWRTGHDHECAICNGWRPANATGSDFWSISENSSDRCFDSVAVDHWLRFLLPVLQTRRCLLRQRATFSDSRMCPTVLPAQFS